MTRFPMVKYDIRMFQQTTRDWYAICLHYFQFMVGDPQKKCITCIELRWWYTSTPQEAHLKA